MARDRPLAVNEVPHGPWAAQVTLDTRGSDDAWPFCRQSLPYPSGAVECMNSVLRMQQSRHRRMTQPMLDLKRLYWNCRSFRSGPRKDTSPYRALGLKLPTYD